MNREPLDESRPDAKNGMDDLLKEVFREDSPPPEVEDRLRDRMAAFRERLDAREERDRQPSRWAFLRAPRTLARLAIAGSAACAVVAAVIALQSSYRNELVAPNKVQRVRDDHRSLGAAIEGYYVDNYSFAHRYDPAQGTTSEGEIRLVREKTDSLGITNENGVASVEELPAAQGGSAAFNLELADTMDAEGIPQRRVGDVDSDGDVDVFYSTNGNASPSIEAVMGDRVVFGRRAPEVLGDGNFQERYVAGTGVGTVGDQVASANAPAPNESMAKGTTVLRSPETGWYRKVDAGTTEFSRLSVAPVPEEYKEPRESGAGTVMFRFGGTDASVLWDAVTPPSTAGSAGVGDSKDTLHWAWATKTDDSRSLPFLDPSYWALPEKTMDSPAPAQPSLNEFYAGAYRIVLDPNKPGGVSPQEVTANIDAEVQALANPVVTPEPPSTSPDYDRIIENPFLPAKENPLSTFSIDVDTASYSNIRRLLMDRQLPPADAVRIEEMINYFPYDYPQPTDDAPFSVTTDVATCPWAPDHRLLRIGLKGYEIPAEQRPPSNLVFLIDVSGSMNSPEKLPLLKEGFKVFVHHLKDDDRVAIVVYAGASGLVLPSTPATDRQAILDAIDRLQSGGSTNGGAGIQLAYDIAVQNFIEGGVNRVILATDGDFNVGITDRKELTRLIEAEAKSGVFLSVLGYGICGCKDATMEELSNKGNGNYAYIDDALEARRVLVDQMSATLVTIAKDVKIQVEFNPAEVAAYRLIGYENRMLAKEDFNDDTKDAGEIGAGHTVTALYELVPARGGYSESPSQSNAANPSDQMGETDPAPCPDPADADTAHVPPPVDALKYQESDQLSAAASSGELLTLKLRYKQPDGDTSQRLEYGVRDDGDSLDAASPDFKFSAAVAGFGLLLRNSEYKGNATFQSIFDLALAGVGADPYTYRTEFVDLVELAATLRGTAIDASQK